MTVSAPMATNLGDLTAVNDYVVVSPLGAWSGAGTNVRVRTVRIGTDIWQYGGDVGGAEGWERIHSNGIWGSWAALGAATPPSVQSTAPTLTSISPTSISDDGTSKDVTLTGTGYVRDSVVYVNNDATTVGATTFTSATTLVRAINTGHASITAGTYTIHVVNPDGKLSNPKILTVT